MAHETEGVMTYVGPAHQSQESIAVVDLCGGLHCNPGMLPQKKNDKGGRIKLASYYSV